MFMASHSEATELSKRCSDDDTYSTIKSATEFDTLKLNNSANATIRKEEAQSNSNESRPDSKTIESTAAYYATLEPLLGSSIESSIKQASPAASFEDIPLGSAAQTASNQLDRPSEANLFESAGRNRLVHSSINHTTDRSSLDHSSLDRFSLVASIGSTASAVPFSDNSLQAQLAILKHKPKRQNSKQKPNDPLHINNLVQSGLNSVLLKNYAANNSCSSAYCNCEYRHGLAGDRLDDHPQFNRLNANSFELSDQCSSSLCNHGAHFEGAFESATDLCSSIDNLPVVVNKTDSPYDSELCKSLKGDLYDHNLNSFVYKKEFRNSSPCEANFSKINDPALSCKDCLFESENCLCNSLVSTLVTTQPSLNPGQVNSNLVGSTLVQPNPLSSANLVNRTKVNPRIARYLEPLLSEPNLKSKTNPHYLSSYSSENSRSSPSLPTQRPLKCGDCFDLFKFTNRTKLTNSLSDSLSNPKQSLTSSLLHHGSSSSLGNSSSSSVNLSFKNSSSGRYLASCLLATKLNLVLRLVRRLYFYLCFLLTLLLSLVPLRNGKDNQHKICEHRTKIMRLKERWVKVFHWTIGVFSLKGSNKLISFSLGSSF